MRHWPHLVFVSFDPLFADSARNHPILVSIFRAAQLFWGVPGGISSSGRGRGWSWPGPLDHFRDGGFRRFPLDILPQPDFDLGLFTSSCHTTGLVTNSILFCWLFTIKDLRFQQTHNQGLSQLFLTVSSDLCTTHLMVILCSSGSDTLVKGPLKEPCQLKKPFKCPRRRVVETNAGDNYFPDKGPMMFYQKIRKMS